MAYLGNQPSNNFVSLKRQVITGDGTASYTLDHSVASVNDVAIFVNNVRQDPASYSISGTALTLGGTIESSDSCYVIFLGQALQTVTPATGTVTGAMMSYPLTNFSSTGIDDNADATAITIDSSENVGIGTTSPTRLLTVENASGNSNLCVKSANTGVSQVMFGDSDSDVIGNIAYNHTNNYMYTEVNGSERMRIHSNGYVSIGTTNNTKLFTTAGEVWLDTRKSTGYGSNSDSGHFLLGVSNYTAVDNGAKLNYRITTTGNQGGHVIRVKYRTRSGDAESGESNGAYCNGTSWVNASDQSMKANITDLSYGLDTINNLQPRAFEWSDTGESDIGFVAQELETQIPEVVSGEDGSKGVNYGAITAVLVKALQEANTKIEELETRIQTLENN